MIEVPHQLVQHVVEDSACQGVLLVDDRDGCSAHAGEVVQCGLKAEQLVEIGAVLNKPEGGGPDDARFSAQAFQDWLKNGLVVYKSVGVSVTDLIAGQRLLQLAKEKQLGVNIADF